MGGGGGGGEWEGGGGINVHELGGERVVVGMHSDEECTIYRRTKLYDSFDLNFGDG